MFNKSIIAPLCFLFVTLFIQTTLGQGFSPITYGNGSNDTYLDVVTDADGNIYVAGRYSGENLFGNRNLNRSGLFVQKLTSTGEHLWVVDVDGGTEYAHIAVDSKGAVYLGGAFKSGSSPLEFYDNNNERLEETNFVSNGRNDIFIWKVDKDGNHIRTNRYGIAGGSESITDLVTDAADNLYIATTQQGNFNIGGKSSSGRFSIWKVKEDNTTEWVVFDQNSTSVGASELVVDEQQNVYVSGSFASSVTLAGTVYSNNGNRDAFLWALDSNGATRWVKTAGGSGSDAGISLALSGDGKIYMAGKMVGITNFDGNNIQHTTGGDYDIFLWALSTTNGNHQWVKTIGGSSWDENTALEVDGLGRIVMSGYYTNSAEIGDETLHNNNTASSTGTDGFIWILDAQGNHNKAFTIGGSDDDRAMKAVINNENDIYVVGFFEGTANIGGNSVTSSGSNDGFLWEIAQLLTDPSTVNLSALSGIETIGITTNANLSNMATTNDVDWLETSIDVTNKQLLINYLQNNITTDNRTATVTISGGALSSTVSVIQAGQGSVHYVALEFYEAVTANSSNPDNFIDLGETVRFKIKVKNQLATNLNSVTGTLSTTNSNITITDNQLSFTNIASGGMGLSSDEAEIIISSSASKGEELVFTLSLEDRLSGDVWNASTFSFPVQPMTLGNFLLDDDNNPDSNGDNDGTPEPGETIEFLPTINNVSQFKLYEVSAQLTAQENFISVWDNVAGTGATVFNTVKYNMVSQEYKAIEVDATNVLPENNFVFDYSNSDDFQEINLDLITQSYLHGSNDDGGYLMKWNISKVFNEGALSDNSLKLNDKETVFIFPNPAVNSLTLKVPSLTKGDIEIALMDMNGKTILRETKAQYNTTENITLNISKIAKGAYFLRIKLKDAVQVKQFIKH